MTASQPPAPAAARSSRAADDATPRRRARGAWAVSPQGLATVARLELRQRVRSTRWIVSLAVFAVVVGGVTFLTWSATGAAGGGGPGGGVDPSTGRSMFGFIVFFVLFLGLLVSPTLSATSINGDRAAGTLASLQVTLLTAAEIVLGKLVAAWLASLAFLAVSVPFIIWALAAGGTPPVALVTTVLLLAAMLAVVCAIGLGWSALTARTSGSAVLTYVSVAGLCVLSLVVFGLSTPLVTATEAVQVNAEIWNAVDGTQSQRCEVRTEVREVVHTERTWWLLAVNPFVIVADAMPLPAEPSMLGDPMTGITAAVRAARQGAQEPLDECWFDGSDPYDGWLADPGRHSPVWPWGLGANVALAAAAVWLAVRRLQVPQRSLARGSRVA